MTPRAAALLFASLPLACAPEPAGDPQLDAAERLVLEHGEGIEDFAALCRDRGTTERALAVHHRLGELGEATARRRLGLQLAEELVDARLYDEYLDGQSWGPNELDQATWMFWHIARELGDSEPKRRRTHEEHARAALLAAGGRTFEALYGLGRDDEAWEAAAAMLEHLDAVDVSSRLAARACRATHPRGLPEDATFVQLEGWLAVSRREEDRLLDELARRGVIEHAAFDEPTIELRMRGTENDCSFAQAFFDDARRTDLLGRIRESLDRRARLLDAVLRTPRIE